MDKRYAGGKMTKNIWWFIIVIVAGALMGLFIGKFIALTIPQGSIKDLFATELSAGLSPATIDLKILELTFGCQFKFSITSIIGIIIAALIFKKIAK
jgi:hypothetical protein